MEEKHVNTLLELSNLLGFSVNSLSAWTRLKGAPKRSKIKGKKYNVTAWKLYIENQGLGKTGNKSGLNGKEREANIRADLLAIRLKEKQNQTYDRKEVDLAWSEKISKASKLLVKRFVSELPPIQVGLEAVEISEMNESAIMEIMNLLSK